MNDKNELKEYRFIRPEKKFKNNITNKIDDESYVCYTLVIEFKCLLFFYIVICSKYT